MKHLFDRSLTAFFLLTLFLSTLSSSLVASEDETTQACTAFGYNLDREEFKGIDGYNDYLQKCNEAADAILDETYQKIKNHIKEAWKHDEFYGQAGSEAWLEYFIKAHQAWINFIDHECSFDRAVVSGLWGRASNYTISFVIGECSLEKTLRRNKEFEKLYSVMRANQIDNQVDHVKAKKCQDDEADCN